MIPTLAKRFWLVFLLAYLIVMGAAALLLVRIRDEQIAQLSQPRAQDAWQDWRSAAAEQAGREGPVQRRTPRSVEPPALVLLRDHFGVMLAATIILGTALLAVILLAVHGVLARTQLAHLNGKGKHAQKDNQGE
jgi:hypothetical protein